MDIEEKFIVKRRENKKGKEEERIKTDRKNI
jgi:hypothetical protein